MCGRRAVVGIIGERSSGGDRSSHVSSQVRALAPAAPAAAAAASIRLTQPSCVLTIPHPTIRILHHSRTTGSSQLFHSNNKEQSNLAEGGIARLYSLGGSTGLPVWLQFAIVCFWLGVGLPSIDRGTAGGRGAIAPSLFKLEASIVASCPPLLNFSYP